MDLALPVHGATHGSRVSPVSHPALFLTLGLAAVGVVASVATKFHLASLPNIVMLVIGAVVLDVLTQLAPKTRVIETIQTILYGFLYLAVTIVCGVLAAYAMQRLAFPLQDQLIASADKMLGFEWLDYAHWVDRHPAVQTVFRLAYNSILPQTVLPLVVLAVASRISELRAYLLAFVIAFAFTIVISALMPAAGPIAFVDRAAFHLLQFTGATPLDHLVRLREAGSLVMDDAPGGIATFPSFHATIAVLTPLTLRGFPRIFAVLLILDAAMLGGTVTEGAHYFCDILAGGGMAFFAHAVAKRVIGAKDRFVAHRSSIREDAAPQAGTTSFGGNLSAAAPSMKAT
ncbi:MAG: phosphatase PAP2 family protein [Xanthobacteraceae bacterium]|nr:phosphatase PAP2 family protein [Xanthobacteraceae bacterium]